MQLRDVGVKSLQGDLADGVVEAAAAMAEIHQHAALLGLERGGQHLAVARVFVRRGLK